jgi:hypothetical protein
MLFAVTDALATTIVPAGPKVAFDAILGAVQFNFVVRFNVPRFNKPGIPLTNVKTLLQDIFILETYFIRDRICLF